MFCPRQWALIHIEQQWADNKLTAEGQLLHKNVDNPFYRQKNGNIITLRSLHVASKTLGLYGITDAVELHPTDSPQDAITHHRYKGHWKPFPVEYKRGHSKPDERDEVQLAAQVMCLEEMYGINIPYGALYYDDIRGPSAHHAAMRQRDAPHIPNGHGAESRQATPLQKVLAGRHLPARGGRLCQSVNLFKAKPV